LGKGKEFQMFGPPGTGKTTRLATVSIPKAVERFGRNGVVVTSFTRAAAKEISGRGIEVDSNCVGTMHSLCYRGLGFPGLTVKHIDQWNAEFPKLLITGAKTSNLDEGGGVDTEGGNLGDDLLGKLNIYRSKMIDESMWPPALKDFYDKWKMFKYANSYMDFTDLIEETLKAHLPPPGEAKMMFVDEAQDLTPLQLALIRQWGKEMDQYMLVGDDDQTIYSFTGANPEAFLDPNIPKSQKKVLDQSYRVPAAVLERAMWLIEQVKIREPKIYKPRMEKGSPVTGKLTSLPEIFTRPDAIFDDIELNIQKGKSCMVLTSCSYMLAVIRKGLIDRKIPFGNKYRKTRGDWNPLAAGGHKRVSPRDLLYSFLTTGIDDNFWNVPHFLMWAKSLKVGENGLKYKIGKKVLIKLQKMMEENKPGLYSCREAIGLALTDNAVERALDRDIDWFMNSVQTKKQGPLTFPIEIYNKYQDIKILKDIPLTTIGTIHSVKGGEADIVYLYPDISMAAEIERQKCADTSAEDALKRLFYVGMTRAKEELILMSPLASRRRKSNQSVLHMDLG